MTGAKRLGQFLELSYVTADLAAAVNLLRSQFGISQWLEFRDTDIDMGNGQIARLHIAVAYLDGVLIEVQQPVSGVVDWYRGALPAHGEAMRPHHLGYAADSPAQLQDLRHRVSERYAVPYFGKFGAQSAFFFADARLSVGLHLEYIYIDPDFGIIIPENIGGPPESLEGRLAGVRQLAWVTNDYDRALSMWRDHFGFHNFLETGLVEADLGYGQKAKLKVAMTYFKGLQYELIAPMGGDDDLYHQALPADGKFAVHFHHAACASTNRDALERRRHQAAAAGYHIPVHSTFGDSAFFYVDATASIGHHLEYVYLAPEFDALIPRG